MYRGHTGWVTLKVMTRIIANHFSNTLNGNNPDRVETLKEEYESMRANYQSIFITPKGSTNAVNDYTKTA